MVRPTHTKSAMTDTDKKPHLAIVPGLPAATIAARIKTAQAATIHDKLIRGIELTTTEVTFGGQFYRDLADRLIQCGPTFALAHAQALNMADALEEIKKKRGI